MDNGPRFQRVDGGLVGLQYWTSPLEGAYTRTAKIGLMNALGPRELCELLFGCKLLQSSLAETHGRSFLNGTWAAPKATAAGQSVLAGFLTTLCGGWAMAIASDTRLRLCCSCADVGYHSALFQIDALSTCPIHGEPLLDACPHCGSPTSRYALSSDAFVSPMQCMTCGRSFGRAWNGSPDFGAWVGPGDVEPLQRLARRLHSWQSLQLQWPTASNWVDDPFAEAAIRRRVRIFHALETLSGDAPDPSAGVMARSCSCSPTTTQMFPLRDKPRIAIYKAIRRQIVKRLLRRQLRRASVVKEAFYVHQVHEAVVPKHAACSPCLHAFALWTRRCEDGESPLMARWLAGRRSRLSAGTLKLRTSLLKWPTDVQVSDSLWGHFLWSCFLEDQHTAWQWQALTAPLGDPLEQDDQTDPVVQRNRARFLEQLSIWAPKMSRMLEAFPSGISQFTWQQGGGPCHLSLVTIQRVEGAFHVDSRIL